jgi:hypothetical protein
VSDSGLEGFDPDQQPPVLPEQVQDEPGLEGDESEPDHRRDCDEYFSSTSLCKPAGDAETRVAPLSPGDHSCQHRQKAVADERGNPDRTRVKLAEAMAVGLPATDQVAGDHDGEEDQEANGTQGAPLCRRGMKEGESDP